MEGELIMREWLVQTRKALNLTQAEVAKSAGISRGAYSNIETGTRDPSVDVAKKLGKCLGFNWTRFYENDCPQKEHSA